jgi:hypothetical protein
MRIGGYQKWRAQSFLPGGLGRTENGASPLSRTQHPIFTRRMQQENAVIQKI